MLARNGVVEGIQDKGSIVSLKVGDMNKQMFIASFMKCLWASQFKESLEQRKVETMVEIRSHAKCHIEVKEIRVKVGNWRRRIVE